MIFSVLHRLGRKVVVARYVPNVNVINSFKKSIVQCCILQHVLVQVELARLL